jgi:hypothetical protein
MAILTPGRANLPRRALRQAESSRLILAVDAGADAEARRQDRVRPELGRPEIGLSTELAKTGEGEADVRRDHFSIRARMAGDDFAAETVTAVAVAEIVVAEMVVAIANRIVILTTRRERQSSARLRACWNCTPRGTASCETRRTITQRSKRTRSYLAQ